MAFNLEFIKDTVLTHDEIHGFENAIAYVAARWKITHSDWPNGFVYHGFSKRLPIEELTLETYIPIEDVTDAQLEAWVISDVDADTRLNIQMRALPFIQQKHELFGLTRYYQNPDAPRTPLAAAGAVGS